MKPALNLFVAVAILAGYCGLALAQTSAPTTFTGCAMPLEGHPDFLTLCEPHTCSLLRGKVDTHWAGHTVTLRGVLRPATSTQPRTVEAPRTNQMARGARPEPIRTIDGKAMHCVPSGLGRQDSAKHCSHLEDDLSSYGATPLCSRLNSREVIELKPSPLDRAVP